LEAARLGKFGRISNTFPLRLPDGVFHRRAEGPGNAAVMAGPWAGLFLLPQFSGTLLQARASKLKKHFVPRMRAREEQQ
jgi:hypothetical protein